MLPPPLLGVVYGAKTRAAIFAHYLPRRRSMLSPPALFGARRHAPATLSTPDFAVYRQTAIPPPPSVMPPARRLMMMSRCREY
jgi:hypothetical protein